jgi:hypothetical protein
VRIRHQNRVLLITQQNQVQWQVENVNQVKKQKEDNISFFIKYMKTRKIYGGLLGMETKKQIKCIEKFIKNVYTFCTDEEQKLIYDLEINTKNNRHFISKLFRTSKSNYEIERDNLLEFLKVKILNKASSQIIMNKYNYLISLIDDIIKFNNKGVYYKTYNAKNDKNYKSNYELFKKTFCDNLDEVSNEFKQTDKLCTIQEDDESYSFMDAPLSVSNNTLRTKTIRSLKSYSVAQGRRKRKGKTHKRRITQNP